MNYSVSTISHTHTNPLSPHAAHLFINALTDLTDFPLPRQNIFTTDTIFHRLVALVEDASFNRTYRIVGKSGDTGGLLCIVDARSFLNPGYSSSHTVRVMIRVRV